MERRQAFVALLLVGIALLIAGCLGHARQTGFSNSSCILLNHTSVTESTFLHAGDRVQIAVNASNPVNVLVLGSKANDMYRNATNASGEAYFMHVAQLNVTRADICLTVPEDDTYYIVVDNTGRVPGGVDGSRDVCVNTSYAYYGRPLF